MSRYTSPIFAVLLLAVVAPLAAAEQGRGRSGDHDDARRAVELRQALPLTRIMEIAQHAVPGEIVKVELDTKHDRLIYEIDILTQTGRLREVELDAETGAVLEVEDED